MQLRCVSKRMLTTYVLAAVIKYSAYANNYHADTGHVGSSSNYMFT